MRTEMEDFLRFLPQEIGFNIFSRLPVESILVCKLVCRAWRDLLQFHADAYLAYQHLLQQHAHGLSQPAHDPLELDPGDGSESAPMSFVFLDGTAQGSQELHYAEYDDKVGDPNFSTKRIKMNLNFMKDVSGIVGSCKGLICLSVKRSSSSSTEPLYICNPITREIVNLPKHNEDDVVLIAHGFGYHPLANEYKVIRICYTVDVLHEPSVEGKVEVYTLGSGIGWRCIGETSYNLCSRYTDWGAVSGVSFNGAIHWLHERSTGIVAFDLVRETFRVLPIPTGQLNAPFMRSLRVMRGSLCLVSEEFDCNDVSWKLELGVLNNYNEEEINSKQLYEYKSWRMPRWGCQHRCNLLFGCTRKGEILIEQRGVVSSYGPKTRTSKEIWRTKYKRERCVEPIPHENSIVSLKALGERSAKIFNETPNEANISI